MEELFVARRRVLDGLGQAHTYGYAVQIGVRETAAGRPYESYGPVIWEEGGEVRTAPDVTADIGRIDELMERLVCGRVSPQSLEEVLADWR